MIISGAMPKAPDYEEKSKLIAEICDALEEESVKAARAEIFKDLVQSVQYIKSHRTSQDASVALRAAKEHLTLAGLYVEKHEHSGKIEGIQVYLPEVKI